MNLKFIDDDTLSLLISDTFDVLDKKLDEYFILPSTYKKFLSIWFKDSINSLIPDEEYFSHLSISIKEENKHENTDDQS